MGILEDASDDYRQELDGTGMFRNLLIQQLPGYDPVRLTEIMAEYEQPVAPGGTTAGLAGQPATSYGHPGPLAPPPVALVPAAPPGAELRPARLEPVPGTDLAEKINKLPATFFNGNPQLEHIRQAAYARGCSPTAVVMAVLTQVAGMTDHRIVLPPLVGGQINMSFYCVLTGGVSDGKTTAVSLARELLTSEDLPDHVSMRGTATGQGMLQSFMAYDPQTKLHYQEKHGLFWYVDEGKSLANEMKKPDGSILATNLCSGWFGEGLGNHGAKAETTRQLAAMSYNMGVLIAVQPENAGVLFEEKTTGLTQRCYWAEAYDPEIPGWRDRPEFPGKLGWKPPITGLAPIGADSDQTMGKLVGPDRDRRLQVKLPRWYEEDLKDRLDAKRKSRNGSALFGHWVPMEERIAVLIAMLGGRVDPEDDDIQRAKLAMEIHSQHIRPIEMKSRFVKVKADAEQREDRHQADWDGAKGKVMRKAVKDGQFTRKFLTSTIGKRGGFNAEDREAIMDQLVHEGLLVLAEGPRWVPTTQAANWLAQQEQA